jgi:CBS domain-containing protein
VRKAAILPVRSIMDPPRTTARASQSPWEALRRMCETGEGPGSYQEVPCNGDGTCVPQECERFSATDLAFVTDDRARFLGLLTATAAAHAALQGGKTVKPLLEKPPIALEPDATVEELMGRVVDYDWRFDRLPVIDGKGKLVGEVRRSTLREVAADLTPEVAANAR